MFMYDKFARSVCSVLKIALLLISIPVPLLAYEMGGVSDSGKQISTDDIPDVSIEDFQHIAVRDHTPYDRKLELLKRHINLPPKIEDPSISLNEDTSSEYLSPLIQAASLLKNFKGILQTDLTAPYTDITPPDSTLAVGPNHVVVMVNGAWAIYDKNGNRLYIKNLKDWWTGVSPPGSPVDPKVIYDNHAGRWVMIAIAVDKNAKKSSYLLSVSDDSDPLGSWWSWNLDATLDNSTSTSNWADYPQLGFDDASAVYITSNQFSFSGDNFNYTKLRIIKKSDLYWVGTGKSFSWYDIWDMKNEGLFGSKVFTLQPVHSLSKPGVEYFVNNVGYNTSGDTITLWKMTNPTSSNPTLTLLKSIYIGKYSIPPYAKQKGGTVTVHTGDCRLLNAVYNMNRIYTTFTEAYNWGSGTVSRIRIIVIDTNTLSTIFNGGYGADNFFYYYPAIYTDFYDNFTFVFNRSSSTEYVGIRYSGKLSTENVIQYSALLKAGDAYYVKYDTKNRNRWGDYSGIGLDPTDGSVWIYSEYAVGASTWGTWIGRTKH